MRMNYTSLLPKRRRRVGVRTLATVVLLVLVIAAVVLWRGGFAAALWQVLGPVVGLRNSLGATAAARAQDELARAQAQLADRDLLAAENTELKKLLGRDEPAGTRVLASVLARPPGTPYDTLVLDVGARHGVAVGDRVYAGGRVVMGEVTEVRDATSVVTLYSAPARELPALLLHAGRATPLTLAGQGAGSFVAQVPAGSAVAVGDTIILSGIAGEIPAAVSAVVAHAGESFVAVYAHLPVNLFELRYVEVAL